MGALRKVMPITSACFIVGWLSIAGVPPLVGLLVEGRDPGLRLGQEPGAVGRRRGHRPAHRLLHDPPGDPGLLRQGRGGTRPARAYPRRPAPSPAPAPAGRRCRGGRRRADGPRGPRGCPPHESPWIMTMPARGAGLRVDLRQALLNLPFGNLDFLHQWLGAGAVPRGDRAGAAHQPAGLEALLAHLLDPWPSSAASSSPSWCTPGTGSRPSSPRSLLGTAGTSTRASPGSSATPARVVVGGRAEFDHHDHRRHRHGRGRLGDRHVGRGLRRYQTG